MPHLLRRVAALTLVSVAGISLLAPLSARSATAVTAEADRLLDAAANAPRLDADRGDAGRAASALSTLALAATAPGAEDLSPATVAAAHPVAPMRAGFVAVAAPPRPTIAVRSSGTSIWDRIAQCESSGNWAINTGNGYYGGLQFDYSTWHGYGGGAFADYPHQATREQQIVVAKRLFAVRGFQPWPACRIKLGLP